MKILVTGAAGFIGSKLCLELIRNSSNTVYGVDDLNDYYSVKLKKKRLIELNKKKNFQFFKIDLKKKANYKKLMKLKSLDVIFHFAAQAGVRFVITNPKKYFNDNVVLFFNIINFAQKKKVKKFFFASSSSVYGDQQKYPVNEKNRLNTKNFYGFSKYINELTAKTFSKLFNLKVIGLRFFTIFGEWGRPDMLIFKYLKTNLEKKNFYLNENGKHYRDFTYIGDVVKILIKINKIKLKDNYNIYNICSNKPIKIINVIKKINLIFKDFRYISVYSKTLKKVEVEKTHGNNYYITKILKNFKFTNFDSALNKTIKWYVDNKIHKIT